MAQAPLLGTLASKGLKHNAVHSLNSILSMRTRLLLEHDSAAENSNETVVNDSAWDTKSCQPNHRLCAQLRSGGHIVFALSVGWLVGLLAVVHNSQLYPPKASTLSSIGMHNNNCEAVGLNTDMSQHREVKCTTVNTILHRQ
ncbi:hypothetical protein DPMN_020042 [Dreissena polymorpha]|uniref:Uncharacterized protein n=1 Tax=Dreissena polymorpha TaxID=45954 RepID=A0A9D4S9U7_DREPO|nr:hypothetical protein DPMN_020042 [Dreissena polymorpha]